jgi:recombination protein RecR
MKELAEATGAVAHLIEEFTKLPGIGPKSAERMVHFLLTGDRRTARSLADALHAVIDQVRTCQECFNLAEEDQCSICADPRRDTGLICVVETPRDLAVLERSGMYRGRYHVLNGRLAPLDNVGPEQLTFDGLLRRSCSEEPV